MAPPSASRPTLPAQLSGMSSAGAGAAAAQSEVFGRPSRAVRCGWDTVDGAMGAESGSPGLVRGGVHEWLGVRESAGSDPAWTPPLFLLAHVARCAVRDAVERSAPSSVVWIGRRVWPYPRALTGGVEVAEEDRFGPGSDPGNAEGGELGLRLALRESADAFTAEGGDLFSRSLFVDPPDAALRLWAIDTALRCGGVTAVVADGSRLGMAATRRLQLAAASADTLVLTARPPSEAGEISAATTRWTVARAPNDGENAGPSWSATLLRAKGAQHLRREHARCAS
ncbi:MAG: hypothetical protein AAGB93_21750 [Planctomycetota bacterium]